MIHKRFTHSALALTLSLGIIFSGTPALASSQKTTADTRSGSQMSTTSAQYKNKSTISPNTIVKHKPLKKLKKPRNVNTASSTLSSSRTSIKSKGSTAATDTFKGEITKTKNEKPSTHTTTSSSEDSNATGATAVCTDGLYSHSATRKGSCSGHGGVKKFLR